jgi:hypothetical protein
MTRNERRQTTILLVGFIGALITAFIGLITADVPKRLSGMVTNSTAWAIAITCTSPLLLLLVINQISLLLKSTTDREEMVREIIKVLPNTSLITHFETSASAMEYLIDNVPRSKRIFNMRLARRDIEEADLENIRVTARFDAAIWKAIQNGTDYNWIVSPEYEQTATSLQTKRRNFSASHQATGNCCCWVLQGGDVPYFHYTVLEYIDHSELLLGWALTSTRSFSEKVFLIRDERMVKYFRRLFETYANIARPPQQNPPPKEVSS